MLAGDEGSKGKSVMQRLLLTTVSVIALGLGATAAMAGGSSSYDSQEGTNQTANIDQSAGTNDSVGTVGNPFDQNNGGGSGGNTITITQTGSYNSFGKTANSFQSGTGNRANIVQNGYNSDVELQQTGTNNGPNDILNTHGYWSNDNDGGLIAQDSTANNSKVSVVQNGSNNAFNIGQGGYGNTTTATQVGDNLLWIRQGTNSPDVWYSPLALSSSENNSTITVSQSGGYVDADHNYVNYAALSQGGGNANQMTVTQVGNANSVDFNQNGSNNVFTSSQSGFGNFVGGESGWPLAESAPFSQSGSGNQYINNQVGNYANANGSQLGNNNYVSNYQSGNYNAISGTQNGNNNQVYSWQTGNYDTLSYSQVASNNYISNSQSGSNNTVTIHQ